MAKVKSLMASGQSGKLDNVVYFKGANGETIARKLVTPKNPNTLAQRYQRVIMKTVNKCYQVMKALADHSFEGKTMGAQCMSRFLQLNARYLRSRAVELQNAGQSLAQFYSFMPLKSDHFTPAAVYISEGSLPQVPVTIGASPSMSLPTNTYKGVCQTYGLRRGDQLTYVVIGKDIMTNTNVLRYARIILDPRNADGSGASMDSEFITDGAVNLPNFRNAGSFTELQIEDTDLAFNTVNGIAIAAGIIVSRKDSNKYWYRSTCKLVISEANMTDKVSLEDAATEVSGELDLINEDAYLNNAGVGGSQGDETVVHPTVDTPIIGMTAIINGVSQNIAGGTVTVTAPLNNLTINGSNLDSGNITLNVDGVAQAPSTSTSQTMQWQGLNVAAGVPVALKMGAAYILRITVQAGGGNNPDGGDDD